MRLGLRAKSALALGVCIFLVLILTSFVGWQTLGAVENNLGTGYARNLARSSKQRILAPVQRELVLSQQFAKSEITRRWLLDEENAAKKELFFAEAERYRESFSDHSYFVASRASNKFYFNDNKGKWSDKQRYTLKTSATADSWFFSSIKKNSQFNLNVDPNPILKLTKVWFNVMVKDRGRSIGILGTGLDFTTFLDRFIQNAEAGVTPMIVNTSGAIQAHPDRNLIDYRSISNKAGGHKTVFQLLPNLAEQSALKEAMQQLRHNDEATHVQWVEINGHHELLAVSYIPELDWYALTAVDLKAARVLDNSMWLPLITIAVLLLLVLVIAIMIAVNRILLTPLLKLTDSARAVAGGNYTFQLPAASHDELGELTRAFGAMATQVRTHTDELENKVRERTRELVTANKQIGDSIQYASMIQNAILPNNELARALADRYFVLWRPRDVVGGDFYEFRAGENCCLLGVVDCAGHGVPGAFMTMAAHTVINVAMDNLGITDPAALLHHVDNHIRAMLQSEDPQTQIAAHMDAGFAYVDFAAQTITFSGAKIALYWCDGENVGEIHGDRRAIGGKRETEFTNKTVPLDPQSTFYLTTDGLLDQAGGPKGYSFGQARFAELLKRHAARPLSEQQTAFAEELAAYQGELSQRDDITVLSFRFTQS